jgi:glyoxylase-like metal-dependent hydrolase (beta-lactamase superfamily II)
MKKYITAILITIASFVNAKAQKTDLNKIAENNANVKIVETGGIKVHTYVNPQLVLVSTHIIELKDSLVIVDAQLTYTFTKEVVAYAELLNKPVARVIFTHAHPDHILGAYAYKDFPMYALAESIDIIKNNGESFRQVFLKNFGEKDAAPQVMVPANELKEGTLIINGVNFIIKKYKDHESDVAATIEIPAAKAFIAGDLIYNEVHLFPGFNHLADWQVKLEGMKKNAKNKIIFPGHGYACKSNVVNENIAYLKHAIEIAAKPNMDVATYKAEMVKAYPNYGAAILIDFGGAALFVKK